MELELKHLAPYLPYGLKCHCSGLWVADHAEVIEPIAVEIVGLNNLVEIHEIGRTVTEEYDYCDVYPILRPLSDLTKENCPEIWKRFNLDLFSDVIIEYKLRDTGIWQYDFVQALIKEHFDINGLIEAGLAIDINTI